MHDGKDENAIRLDSIDKTVRKPGNEKTPEMAPEAAAAVGKRRYALRRTLNRADELEAEIYGLDLEESSGRDQLSLCLGMGTRRFSPKRRSSLPEDVLRG